MEDNRILVIIDPQNDFVYGSLAVEGGKKAMDRLAEWLSGTSTKFSAVVMSRDWHPEDHCSFKENGGVFPKHCVQETEGSRYYKPVASAVARYCIDNKVQIYDMVKGADKEVEEFSAFSALHGNYRELGNLVDEYDTSEIWIAGLATDYCVYNSAIDILKYLENSDLSCKVRLVVMRDFMAAVDPSDTKMDLLVENASNVSVFYSRVLEKGTQTLRLKFPRNLTYTDTL